MGVGVSPRVDSSRSGEPTPRSVLTVGVAFAIRRLRISAGVAVGVAASRRTTAPVTCAVAIDVPDRKEDAVFDPIPAERMASPGAKMSRQLPKLE